MIIFNDMCIDTAKVIIVKTFIGSRTELMGYGKSLREIGLDGKEVMYVSLYDKKPSSISVGDMREKYKDLQDFLRLTRVNVVVDDTEFRENKNGKFKQVKGFVFDKIFGKNVGLWSERGIFVKEGVKWLCGFRGESLGRECQDREVLDSEFVVKEDLVEIVTIENEQDAIEAFRELYKSKVLYVDTEASGLKPFAKDFKLYTIQITGDLNKNKSYIFMYEHPKKVMTESYKTAVKKGVTWLLESNDKKDIWIHNASYDLLVFNSVFGLDTYKINIFDSMIIYHFLTNTYNAVPLGLKEICFTQGILWDWDSTLDSKKKEICLTNKMKLDDFKYEYFDLDDLLLYAGYDTVALAHLVDRLYVMSKEHIAYPEVDVIEDTWNNHWKSIMQSLYKVMINGLPFNMELALESKNNIEKRVAEIDNEIEKDEHIQKTERLIDKIAYDKALEVYKKKCEEAEAKGKIFKGKKPSIEDEKYGTIVLNNKFSSTSLAHKRLLIFDILGLEILATTDSGLPQLSDDILTKYFEENPEISILQLFGEKAKLMKTLTTYVLPWIELVENDRDGRLRSTFNPLNTSGRLRGNSPNLLNITKDGGLKEIIQADNKNGFVVGQIDVNALEERSALLLHKDKVKLMMKETGVEDLHSLGAITISKAKNDGILGHLDATIPEHLKIVKKEFPHLRQEAKALKSISAF